MPPLGRPNRESIDNFPITRSRQVVDTVRLDSLPGSAESVRGRMEREQQPVIIDLDDQSPRRAIVTTALVVVLLAVLAIAPLMIENATSHGEATSTSIPAGQDVPPALCYPSLDVPRMLDPLASVILPGWARLCGWLTQPDIVEPPAPSG